MCPDSWSFLRTGCAAGLDYRQRKDSLTVAGDGGFTFCMGSRDFNWKFLKGILRFLQGSL